MGTVRLPVVGMFAAGLATLLPAFLISCAIGAVTNNVTVGGIDYAFDAPDTLPPGPTAIAFENRGQVPHEMILVRLKKGVTLEEVMQAVQGGSDPSEFTEGGPGHPDRGAGGDRGQPLDTHEGLLLSLPEWYAHGLSLNP